MIKTVARTIINSVLLAFFLSAAMPTHVLAIKNDDEFVCGIKAHTWFFWSGMLAMIGFGGVVFTMYFTDPELEEKKEKSSDNLNDLAITHEDTKSNQTVMQQITQANRAVLESKDENKLKEAVTDSDKTIAKAELMYKELLPLIPNQ